MSRAILHSLTSCGWWRAAKSARQTGFTLLEVMLAVGVLGIAMLALLSLHHSNLDGVIRAQEMSKAAMLAQGLMTQAELEKFPMLGESSGDFEKIFPGLYSQYRWGRNVEASGTFPDIRKVEVTIFYGPHFRNAFSIVEFIHNPIPPQQEIPGQFGGRGGGRGRGSRR